MGRRLLRLPNADFRFPIDNPKSTIGNLKFSFPSLPHRTGIKGTLQRTMVQHEQYTETPSINQLRIVRGIGDPRIDFSLEDLMVFLLPERENNKKVPMDGYLP